MDTVLSAGARARSIWHGLGDCEKSYPVNGVAEPYMKR